MIQVQKKNQILIAELNRGVTNAINLELINELSDIVKKTEQDIEVHGLVLSSANEKFFSIGFDIPELFELDKKDFMIFYRAFNRLCLDLYTLPKPTIAAITGHAVAGGCIIALCCDYRYIAPGKTKMGLNEIKLGVPIPYPVDCMLRQILGFRIAREITDAGDFYEADALLGIGMVDDIIPIEKLQTEAVARAALLGGHPQNAFAMIKRSRTETTETQILSKLEEKEEAFLERWYAEETRERLKEAMKKF
ncbi:MAG: enoyl-CoA hydratase/isomerase family protein [bacterium]